jgi:hypothetical protein
MDGPVKLLHMPMDSRLILALAIVFATLVAAWMFRYECMGPYCHTHRNRLTGAECSSSEGCWLGTEQLMMH